MGNKIKISDIIVYFYKILNGNFMPFLKNEIDDKKVKKTFFRLKKKLDNTNYNIKLLRFLEEYYSFKRDIFLTNSGRDALYFLLKNLKFKKKEIIIPSYSCLGLIEPIMQLNFTPRFIDIDDQLNPSFDSIKKTINEKTAAVIIPHLGGTFAKDTFKIIKICKKKKITVIEDCCQAFGLQYKDKPIGTFADISFFSSGVGKPIFAPCGGWIVTKRNLFKKFSMSNLVEVKIQNVYSDFINFRKRFSDNKFEILKTRITDKIKSIFESKRIGKNFSNFNLNKKTLNNLSAYMILEQLKIFNENINKRKRNAERWKQKLKDNSNIKILDGNNSIYNKLYIKSNLIEKKKFLLRGIEVENGYVPLHLRYNFEVFKGSNLQNTENLWQRVYSLPIRPSLNTKSI